MGRRGARRRSTSRPEAGTWRGGSREAGLEVVSCDPAPGMQPDVICFAEELPFADSAFDLAVTRVAAHHFADVAAGDAGARPRRRPQGGRRRQPLRRRRRPRRRRRSATPRTSATTPRRSGAASSPQRRHRARGGRRSSRTRSSSSRGSSGRSAPARTAERVRAAPRRPDHGRRRRVRAHRAQGQATPDGDPRRRRAPASSSRASPAARAASTACATARTARTSSPGVTPGKGGQDVEGIPVFDTVAEAVAEQGANTLARLRPRALRRRRGLRGSRRRDRHGRLHHRAHPGARHAEAARLRPRTRRDHDRPQLPRRALAGQGERRDHPGGGLRRRPDRARLPLGHAHLPDRQRARPARDRQLDASSASAATP